MGEERPTWAIPPPFVLTFSPAVFPYRQNGLGTFGEFRSTTINRQLQRGYAFAVTTDALGGS